MKRISETQIVGIIGDISGKRIKCRHDFVAAIVYKIDLHHGTLECIGAGIDEFYAVTSEGILKRYELKGPFLGMFEHLSFDVIRISIADLDRIIFFTDGIGDLIKAKFIDPGVFKEKYQYRLVMALTEILSQRQKMVPGLSDDSSAVIIDFHSKAKTLTHILYGLKNYQGVVDQLVAGIAEFDMRFKVQLIITELLTNANKHGNAKMMIYLLK